MVRVERLIIASLPIILILSTSYFHEVSFAQEHGSRTEDLIIKFYPNIEQAYNALKNGSIDIVNYEIPSDLYEDAINDPNIVLAPVVDRVMYEFDINNNYSTPYNPSIRSPTNYREFRQAIAYLVDKDYIVENLCGGFVERIDQPLSACHSGWINESMWHPNYPYEFDPQASADLLDAAGFIQGSTNNPDYDPTFPGSAHKLRTYPSGHTKAGQILDQLDVVVRTDDFRRLQAGRQLIDNMRKHGIPVNPIEPISIVQIIEWVYDWRDYHIYTGGWSLGRFPSRTAYYLYHSSQYFLGSSNYVTGVDQNGDPNYPELDELLEAARYPDNYTEAISATKRALGYFTEECITIPLFSPRSFWAWSTNLLGVVNGDGVGSENDFTFLNAYKVDGSPIRVGIKTPPIAMNKIYSQWFYDYQCLDRMDLYSGKGVPPYNIAVDQGGYILNWTEGLWTDADDSTEKTLVIQIYKDNAWFVEPVTGNQLEQVNATHLYASIWYEYQLSDAWNNDGVIDIKTCRMAGSHTIEIYWNTPSYWNTYLGSTSIKSFNWWSKGNLSKTVTESLTADPISGYVDCSEQVFYVLNAKSEGTQLTVGVDYDIYFDPDGPHNADVRIVNSAYLGADLNLTYLATNDAHGYYPGGLSWQDCFEGAGMYYATDFNAGAGGNITLKRNPFYPTETPIIGEIDFVKKSGGCYKVDIFDVVIAASAYGSQGISIPDSHWFAGADLASPGGRIDIFDIVTVASDYGTVWDCHQ